MTTYTEEMERMRLDWQRKPDCPDWCLPNWCAVRPVLDDDRRPRMWTGFHLTEVYTVAAEYGITAEVAVGASQDEPDDVHGYLRLADRASGEEIAVLLTEAELVALKRAVDRTLTNVRLCREHG